MIWEINGAYYLWNADTVLIEELGTAIALLEELKFEIFGVIGIKPDRDKISRMSVASAVFEARQVFFPENAPWLPELERELFSFPGGKFDDQVDFGQPSAQLRPVRRLGLGNALGQRLINRIQI